jgi:hypothetical protein
MYEAVPSYLGAESKREELIYTLMLESGVECPFSDGFENCYSKFFQFCSKQSER